MKTKSIVDEDYDRLVEAIVQYQPLPDKFSAFEK